MQGVSVVDCEWMTKLGLGGTVTDSPTRHACHVTSRVSNTWPPRVEQRGSACGVLCGFKHRKTFAVRKLARCV